MINHFKSYLCNRGPGFFEDSLFHVFVEPSFKPSPETEVTKKVRTLLFGEKENASSMDYRFYQFLRLIAGCGFSEHVHRYDKRDTYFLENHFPAEHTVWHDSEKIEQVISKTLDLPSQIFHGLFAPIRKIAPEYEEGFKTITDSLTKFCMVLFALAVATEQQKDAHHLMEKRLRDSDGKELPPNAEGTFYYGSYGGELLTMATLKGVCQFLTVNSRRQVFEMPVPDLAYVYLAWPTRFGLPAHNRILVDGMLNSGWHISSVEDIGERYTVLRSIHKIRTDTPIIFEIL